MRRVREVLRLKWGLGLSARQVARSCGLAHPTVFSYVRRAEACGLSWPLPASLDDEALERRLFPPLPPSTVPRPESDWLAVHRELKRKGMTLQLFWDEYKAAHPRGYQYTAFCVRYRRWRKRLDVHIPFESCHPFRSKAATSLILRMDHLLLLSSQVCRDEESLQQIIPSTINVEYKPSHKEEASSEWRNSKIGIWKG